MSYRFASSRVILTLVLWLSCVALAGAQDETSNPDEEAVRQASRDYLDALRCGDAEALLELWTEDGDFVDQSGATYKAHDLIREQFAGESTAGAPDNLSITVQSIRFVTPDVAIEDGISQLDPAPADDSPLGRFTAVWVRRDGRWKLSSVRESTVAAASAQSELHQVEWLIGQWVGTTEQGTIEIIANHAEGGAYISRDFTIRDGDQIVLSGTQYIGWDAVDQEIRSWAFDSRGAFSAGTWTQQEGKWQVVSAGYLADGSQTYSKNIYTLIDPDHFTWESIESDVAGNAIPDRIVHVERQGTSE